MKLKEGLHYKLVVKIHGREKDYEGKVLSVKKGEFRFSTEEDNGCHALTFHFDQVMHAQEIEPPRRGAVLIKKRKYTKPEDLSPSETPEGL